MWVIAAVVAAVSVVAGTPCEEARVRCAYRTGCGSALNNYMLLCSEVMAETLTRCPKECEHALIALMSTEEGKELMNCQCEDDYCVEAKERMEVCRPQVMRGAANATASCSLSQLICLADAQCATALSYYNELCRSMYHRGRKCSKKCLNSIEILRKQEKAAALVGCRCDGNEDYDCPKMQSNLQRLCFKQSKPTPRGPAVDSRGREGTEEPRTDRPHRNNQIKVSKNNEKKHHHKKIHHVVNVSAASASVRSSLAFVTLLLNALLHS